MGALTSLEHACVEAASAEPMLAQVENWSAVNSGSRNLDGLGIIGARLAGAFADLPGEVRMVEPARVEAVDAAGKTYEVADVIYKKEIVSEMYSTSGDFDLLIKVYVDEEQDIGKFINDNIATVPGINRSLTTLTFNAF